MSYVEHSVTSIISNFRDNVPAFMQHVLEQIMLQSAKANIWTLILITMFFVLLIYYIIFEFIPGLYIDMFLAKLPTMRGGLPFIGHAHILAGPAPWTKMAQWSLHPNKNAHLIAETESKSISSSYKSNTSHPISHLVSFNVAGMRVVYINEPRLLKRVLLTNQRNYNKAIDAAYKHFKCLLGTGLVTSEGEHWKKGRLLLSRALRIDILNDVPLMTMKAVDRIMQKLSAIECTDVQPSEHDHNKMAINSKCYVDLCEEFRHMTLQVIGEAALSLTAEETDCIFPPLYLPIVHECNKRVWAPWRAYMPFLEGSRERNRCLKELNRVLDKIIVNRWNAHKCKQNGSIENNDAAATNTSTTTTINASPITTSVDGDKSKGKLHKNGSANKSDILLLCMSQINHMDSKVLLELRDDVKTMLLAGHETSAALLTWAAYETIRHPRFRDEIVKEAQWLFDPARCTSTVDTIYGIRGLPSADDVRELIYTPAVLRETLRLHSVVPLVMRYAVKRDVWPASETGLEKDVTIPAGCTIAVGIEGVHKNPTVWSEPDKFDPERFIDAEIANNTNMLTKNPKDTHFSKSIDPYAFMPFINGPRNCMGQHLSLMETQVALSYLFLNWNLYLCKPADTASADEKHWEDEVGRHHDYIIPQIPHDGLKVYGTRIQSE